MVPVGDRPILWHIMKTYAHFGHKEFIICLGYKGDLIKDYFRNYHWNTSDVTLRLGAKPEIRYHNEHDEEDWEVTLVDTGKETQTGGRIRRVLPFIEEGETFLMTYGDGLTDSDINETIRFHQESGAKATMTAVSPAGRFGDLEMDEGGVITSFMEKPEEGSNLINGGYFVMDRRIADYLPDDSCVFERDPMARLVGERQLAAYVHRGFWQCMDTFREQQMLTRLW